MIFFGWIVLCNCHFDLGFDQCDEYVEGENRDGDEFFEGLNEFEKRVLRRTGRKRDQKGFCDISGWTFLQEFI